MATTSLRFPAIYSVEYRQEKHDKDYGTCLWADFHIDCTAYTLFISSDCGQFSYGWHRTPNRESFLHLLCRMEREYLLNKIAEKTIVDHKITANRLSEYIASLEAEYSIDVPEEDRRLLLAACNGPSFGACFWELQDALQQSALYGKYDIETVESCIKLTEPTGAKKIAEIFERNVQPVLKELCAKTNSQGGAALSTTPTCRGGGLSTEA